MNWFYVKNGAQAGPVDRAELDRLAQTGEITPETLVWMQGMATWQPYSGSALSAAASPTETQAVCVECHKAVEKSAMIQYGEAWVCSDCKPVFLQKLSEGVAVNVSGLRYAGFWIRAGAWILDCILLGIVISIPMFAIVFLVASTTKEQGPVLFVQLLVQLLATVVQAAYFIFFVGKYGATPGKMICGLKIVDASGAAIGYGRATGRFFAQMLSMLICYIGYIMVAFDDEKRGLHDRICNTRVVHK
ncbi:hypothetical protein BH09VER1_BH09VER1_42880 [soil metagenome]